MRLTLMIATLLTLTACGWVNRQIGYLTGYSLVCVEETHVLYVQFPTGAAVLVDADGKPKACGQ